MDKGQLLYTKNDIMKKTLWILLFTLLASCGLAFGQTVDRTTDKNYMGSATVGTDTTAYTATDASAWLQVGRDSTNKGFLLPRVTDTSAVSSPAYGLVVFSHADSAFYVYKDHWVPVGSSRDLAAYVRKAGVDTISGDKVFSGENQFGDIIKVTSATPGHNVVYFSNASGGNGETDDYNVVGFNGTKFYISPKSGKAAQFDATGLTTERTYTLPDISGTLATTDSSISPSKEGAANGIATLDANGKLKTAQVPAIAITNTFVVSSKTAMLALDADTGDIAIRTDSSETFILQNTPASTYDNWKKLLSPGAPVSSVNGKTGTVTLTTDDVDEGSTNKYYTDARVATVVGDTAAKYVPKSDSADGGYVPYSQSTLQAVTDRGATTTNSINCGSVGIGTALTANFSQTSFTRSAFIFSSGSAEDPDSSLGGLRFTWATGNNAEIQMFRGDNATDGAGLSFLTSSNTSGAIERMRIGRDGNVGIGTISPSAKLDVNGDGLFSSNIYVGTSSPLALSDANYMQMQIGDGGVLVGGIGIGKGTFLTANLYRNNSNWLIANSNTENPSELALVHGSLTFYTSPTGASGSIANMAAIFSVDHSGNITAAGGFFSGITGFGGTASSPDATINGLGQGSFQTLGVGDNYSVDNSGNVTAESVAINGGTSSEYLMADGSTSTGGGSPLTQSVNAPLTNPSGTTANTDVQLQLGGSSYSLTIPSGTFADDDNILIRVKFMYDFDITSGTTASAKLDVNGTKYAITPSISGGTETKGMGEVDITDVGTDTLHIVESNEGAYLGDDLIIGVSASDAITLKLFYKQSVTSLGDECHIRPFTVEVMKAP